ncbi:hypothetical protein LB507_002642 [Fusarium sp. FIESC RH6]|nr:hypothetical protein LB507_002642 [Fusarium sp. FIESC RH6]
MSRIALFFGPELDSCVVAVSRIAVREAVGSWCIDRIVALSFSNVIAQRVDEFKIGSVVARLANDGGACQHDIAAERGFNKSRHNGSGGIQQWENL